MKGALNRKDTALTKLGQGMITAWTIMLGIPGFILLLALVAAFVAYSYMLAAVFGLPLVTPLLLTLIWGMLAAGEVVRDLWAELQERDLQTLWERSQGLRVVYKAYFG